jgi:hypothetical protein
VAPRAAMRMAMRDMRFMESSWFLGAPALARPGPGVAARRRSRCERLAGLNEL